MKIGLIGLGKMGINIGKQFIDRNHQVVGYDVNQAAVDELKAYGAEGTTNLKEFISLLPAAHPMGYGTHGIVDAVLRDVSPLLSKGDMIIEAGNSHYKESIRRYNQMKEAGIHYLDAGTSGGMEGARHGACFMVGGDHEAWEIVEPLFRDTASKMVIYTLVKREADIF